MGMLRYKNTQFEPIDGWMVNVGPHRDMVEEINGYVEIEDWDDLANWYLNSTGTYELVTDENPDPQFGDTDFLKVMEQVEANALTKKQEENAKAQDEADAVKSAQVVADVEAAIAAAKETEATVEVVKEEPVKKTTRKK